MLHAQWPSSYTIDADLGKKAVLEMKETQTVHISVSRHMQISRNPGDPHSPAILPVTCMM